MRPVRILIIAGLLAGMIGTLQAGNAAGSTGQIAMFQDDIRVLSDPGPALAQIRDLGAGVVRVSIHWGSVAPLRRPPRFDPADPASYPAANWAVYDRIVSDARGDGLTVDFSVSGPAPLWASGPGQRPPATAATRS